MRLGDGGLLQNRLLLYVAPDARSLFQPFFVVGGFFYDSSFAEIMLRRALFAATIAFVVAIVVVFVRAISRFGVRNGARRFH